MFESPPFFREHQLAIDADDRQIKRAYAKALKLIDQESELEKFQYLRETYEQAVSWYDTRQWRAPQIVYDQSIEQIKPINEFENASIITYNTTSNRVDHATPPIIVLDVTKHVHLEKNNVFLHEKKIQATQEQVEFVKLVKKEQEQEHELEQEQKQEILKIEEIAPSFETGFDEMNENASNSFDIAQQMLSEVLVHLQGHEDKNNYASEYLSNIIEDERLINVETRDYFEYVLATHLVKGWSKGNGDLFDAAVDVFAWEEDKQRILRFSEFGSLLDKALDEFSAFRQLKLERYSRMLALIQRGRSDYPFNKQFLRMHIFDIDHLVEHYPNLLYLVTNAQNLDSWRAKADEWKLMRKSKYKKEDDSSWPSWIFAIFFFLYLISKI